jgi:hypothetical protein
LVKDGETVLNHQDIIEGIEVEGYVSSVYLSSYNVIVKGGTGLLKKSEQNEDQGNQTKSIQKTCLTFLKPDSKEMIGN